MIAADPPATGDPQWDAFVGALAEWLAASVGQCAPEWTRDERRFLDHGWWVTPMNSMRAWEYAGAPVSFKRRGVHLHRDSLTNVQDVPMLSAARILDLFRELLTR